MDLLEGFVNPAMDLLEGLGAPAVDLLEGFGNLMGFLEGFVDLLSWKYWRILGSPVMHLLEMFWGLLPWIYSMVLGSAAMDAWQPEALCFELSLGHPESLPAAIPVWFLRQGGSRNKE